MHWRTTREPEEYIDVFTGTLDQEILLGPNGKTFCTPTGGRCWCCREIPGVTSPGSGYGGGESSDREGTRWYEGSKLGKIMDG